MLILRSETKRSYDQPAFHACAHPIHDFLAAGRRTASFVRAVGDRQWPSVCMKATMTITESLMTRGLWGCPFALSASCSPHARVPLGFGLVLEQICLKSRSANYKRNVATVDRYENPGVFMSWAHLGFWHCLLLQGLEGTFFVVALFFVGRQKIAAWEQEVHAHSSSIDIVTHTA